MTCVLIFASNPPTQRNSPHLLGVLRALARFGADLGALGLFVLAQAGLIDARSTVLHWEATATFRERFPKVRIHNQFYMIGDRRMHSGGDVSPIRLSRRHFDVRGLTRASGCRRRTTCCSMTSSASAKWRPPAAFPVTRSSHAPFGSNSIRRRKPSVPSCAANRTQILQLEIRRLILTFDHA